MGIDADLVTENIRTCDKVDAALHDAQNALLMARTEIAALRDALVSLRAGRATATAPAAALPGPPVPEEVPRPRGPVARIIVDALEEAGDAGLSGAALNRVVDGQGYKKDTAEKAKTALKRDRLVRHDRAATHWYARGRGPRLIPGEE